MACNFVINEKIAKEMSKVFFEVILAKNFDKRALEIFGKRKNLILIDISKFKIRKNYEIRKFSTDPQNKAFFFWVGFSPSFFPAFIAGQAFPKYFKTRIIHN